MPRPKRAPVDPSLPTSWHWDGVTGYVENRNGWCRYRRGTGFQVSLEMRFEPANQKRAERMVREIDRKIREKKIADRVNRELGIVPAAPAAPVAVVTVFEAQRAFKDARLRGAGTNALQDYAIVFERLFPVDMPLTDAGAEERVETWHREMTLGTSRATMYRARLSAFFRYCQDKGWLKGNPTRLIEPARNTRIERTRRREEKRRLLYTPDDIQRMAAWFEKQARLDHTLAGSPRQDGAPVPWEQYAGVVRLLFWSFMRPGEARTLKWRESVDDPDQESHIDDRCIYIRNTKTGEDRIFPYRHGFPELADAIAALRRYATKNHGWVLPHRDHYTMVKIIRCALADLRIPSSNRPAHLFRASGEHVAKLRYPVPFVCLLAGHDPATHEESYAKTFSVAEMEMRARTSRYRSADQADEP